MKRAALHTLTVFSAILGLGALLLSTASCDLFSGKTQDCGDTVPELEPIHKDILSCAGWLGYVEEHVGVVEYLNVHNYQSEGETATGSAFCGRCKVQVATVDWSDFTIAKTLVHEAAHLLDDCKNGENPAWRADRQFELDFRARACFDILNIDDED